MSTSSPPPPAPPARSTTPEAPPSHDAGQSSVGAEPPPRGVGIMAVVRWAILLAVTALAAATLWSTWGPSANQATRAGEPRFYCPMHPEITSPVPGECPICHMTLEPIPADRMHRAGPMGTGTAPADGGTPAASGAAMLATRADGAGAGDATAAATGVAPVTLTLERRQAIGITTTPARVTSGGDTLRAPAVVEAPEDTAAQVHVRAPGFIERVAVSETGVRVARGQTLAWYYSPQIFQAQQEFLTAHRWTTRAAGASAASTAATSDAGAVATAAPSALERASRQNLELLGMHPADIDAVARADAAMRAVPIRAPAAGFVTRRAAVLGAYVTPETSLYDLEGLTRVWIVASVFSSDLPRIRRGSEASFAPASLAPSDITDAGAAPIAARVALIEPEITAETRTARVRLEVANPALRLRPGQSGEVRFVAATPTRPLLTVPRDAVIDTGTQQYVFVEQGEGRFEPRRVRTGALRDGDLEITAGLSEGERVVTRGAFLLDSESRLEAAVAGGAR